MSRPAWVCFRGYLTRVPGTFIRTQATTRTFFSSPAYKMQDRQSPNGRPGNSKTLASAVAGLILLSIVALTPKPTPSSVARAVEDLYDAATDLAQARTLTTAAEFEARLNTFCENGRVVLGVHLNQSDITTHGVVSLLEGSRTHILSAPDPYDTEKRFLVYQSYFPSPHETTDGELAENVQELRTRFENVLMSRFERQKRDLGVYRGVIITFSAYRSWIIYFDGGSFIRVIPTETFNEPLTQWVWQRLAQEQVLYRSLEN
ncbi:hypothetical protein F4821DRAFT_224210 [Hypoxylon rubiginosum]|uniref:Uncharacterized protein n=1 Tax=Hypoxylon rubiginosum TaxID=110542 RepID=A0ACC0DK09_9PEZI|nr:hypothetical protein F4821DRAFT_224210 [Hypoxylon rubiginosum]